MDLDGVVIATPSALHAEQARQAFAGGVAVFCQKPLGRDLAETRAVIDAARAADRLLGVDLSYRHLAAVEAVRALLRDGELGRVYAAELTFHNAYGPDKPWFTRRSQSGGGCLIDLGTHLLDLVMWLTRRQRCRGAQSRAVARRRAADARGPKRSRTSRMAQLRLDSGSTSGWPARGFCRPAGTA